ncbi:hypothetical protein Goshw_000394 [Gossypium schwendimanii]|uniref:Uncharacterized protein n=1 Tax=Gossypium schwendimanii TaxID=34291 RepID=A0A7J9N4N5_GOSSC|nr:hypothetical protein [Gossypium schwendimanii]
MALVIGKDMAAWSFARTFADIDLDDSNQDSMAVDCDNEEVEVRTNVSSSGTSKRKRKNVQESVLMNKLNLWVNNLARLQMHWNNLLRIRHHIFMKK